MKTYLKTQRKTYRKTQRISSTLGACALGVGLFIAGCDDTTFSGGSGGGEGVTGSTYTDLVTLFDNNCLSCHSAGAKLGGLDLETDPCASLVGVTASGYGAPRVDPGNADGSVLYNKVAATGVYGGGMPQGGTLDGASIDAVKSWIDAGASCDSGGADSGGADGADGGGAGDYSFARVQEEVFNIRCTSCHGAGAGEAFVNLDLSEGAAHGMIVGEPSVESADGLNRVTPGSPETSFLYMKIRNTIDEGGTEGDPMPQGSVRGLDNTDELALVYGWILEGANP